MPCDTTRTISVDIGKLDPTLADAAIRAARLEYSVSYKDGALKVSSSLDELETVRIIKQAYSAEVVKSQAKRFGWGLKEVGQFKYEVTKR